MEKRTRPASRGISPLVFIIPAAIILILALYFLVFRKGYSEVDAACQETVSRLKAMEASDVSQVELELNKVIEEAEVASVSDVQADILNGNILDNVEIRQDFANTAIIGDSITESIWEYGYLDQDVVISKRGLSVVNADEQIETAISMYPSVIFMAFGSNDLEYYEEDYTPFINAYRNQIHKLQEALPGVPIYINLILPIEEWACEATPALKNYPQYNEALKELCEETGCNYIDNSFILDNQPELYEPDGEHVVSAFYPQWLTYMAKIAGLA